MDGWQVILMHIGVVGKVRTGSSAKIPKWNDFYYEWNAKPVLNAKIMP